MVQRQPAPGHPPFAPPAPPKGEPQAAPVTGGFLIRTGRAYEEAGNIHQARYVYFNVIDRYPETKEAQEAFDRLLKMAQEYEENGQLYMAKHLYIRIEDAMGL